MRKIISSVISAALCFGFAVTASAEEGGLVPTVKGEGDGTSYSKEYIEEHAEEYAAEGEIIVPKTSITKHFGANEPVPAVRDDGEPIVKYLDMGELYHAWHRDTANKYGYPDYVCGVWTETGDMSELVVAVTKDEKGNAGKEEILSLIENDNTVKFVYQIYSYTELRDIQEELSPLMADNGVYGLGVDEMNNRVNVDVDMNHPNINAFMEECNAKYGDRVYFEAGSEIILEAGEVFTPTVGAVTSEETFTPVEIGGVFTVEETYKAPDENGADGAAVITIGASENKADNPWIFVLCAAVVVFLAGMVFVLNKNKAKQTTAGTIVGGTSLNLRETEKLVFESAETPSGKVFEEVMKEIGE